MLLFPVSRRVLPVPILSTMASSLLDDCVRDSCGRGTAAMSMTSIITIIMTILVFLGTIIIVSTTRTEAT